MQTRRRPSPDHQLHTVRHRIIAALAWSALREQPPRRPAGIPRARWRRALAQLADERARDERTGISLPHRSWGARRLGWVDAVEQHELRLRQMMIVQGGHWETPLPWSLRCALHHSAELLEALRGERGADLLHQAHELAAAVGQGREALVWASRGRCGISTDLPPERWGAICDGEQPTASEREAVLRWLENDDDIPF